MGIEHRRLRESIGLYVLGQLEPFEMVELGDHLAGCQDCRREEEELRPVAELLRTVDLGHLEDPELPADLEQRVVTAVLPRPAPPLPQVAAALAGVAVLVAIALALVPRPAPAPADLGVEEAIAFSVVPPGVAVDGAVVAHTWGTEVKLEVEGLPAGVTYTVVVEPESGPAVIAGTMIGVKDRPITCALNGAVPRDQARSVIVVDADGGVVLRSNLETARV